MPRPKKWPPTITFHKASGQDRVRIDGRDHYLGPHGSEEAKAAYVRLIAGQAAPQQPPVTKKAAPGRDSSPLTVADLAAEWWSGPGARYSERGREAPQFRRALLPLLRLYGPTPAADFGADELESLRQAMASGSWMTPEERDASSQPRWCANRCNRMCGRVKTVWRWCERRKLVPRGSWGSLCALPPVASNDASVRHTEPARACTWDELRLVLAHCVRPVKAMLLLQWHAGMRSGEVRLMRGRDLDRSDPGAWVYRPAEHKNDWRPGQERAVALGPEARKVLAPFLCEWEAEGSPREAYLFVPTQRKSERGHYGATTYAQAVRRASISAGVQGFTAYMARHAAKARIAKALGLEAARQVLGQKSIQAAARYASQADLDAAKEAAKRLG